MAKMKELPKEDFRKLYKELVKTVKNHHKLPHERLNEIESKLKEFHNKRIKHLAI